jgi:sterol desaturase/sphingolipid hydroxylase (fatty acid hydroxylase superfamily)
MTGWQSLANIFEFLSGRTLVVSGCVFACLWLARRLLEARAQKSWGFARFFPDKGVLRSVFENFGLTFLNSILGAVFFVGLYAAINGFWTDVVGLTPPDLFAGWPFALIVLVLIVMMDFTNYWSHRLLHRPWMWSVHTLHHSDEHMNFSTSFRVHIIEVVQMKLVFMLLMGWMVLPVEALALASILRKWYSCYVHSGLAFDHGRVRKLLVSPNYHRWHHADDPAVYGKNLADMLPLWDLAFGTHHDPGRCNIPAGVSDAPDSVLQGQVYPLVYFWRKRPRLQQAARKAV